LKDNEYQIISSPSIEGLEEEVNEYLSKGFYPIGGVSMAYTGYDKGDMIYAQAVIKQVKMFGGK